MAFRFRREGQFVKNRVHLDRSGFRPFMDELKWEVFEWHYNHHMGPLAVRTLMKHQQSSEMLQYMLDFAKTGTSAKFPTSKARFFFATALPIIRPFRRSSNPFCPVSPNTTGYQYFNGNLSYLKRGPTRPGVLPRLSSRKTGYPVPHGTRKIGGTDPRPPIFPKGV